MRSIGACSRAHSGRCLQSHLTPPTNVQRSIPLAFTKRTTLCSQRHENLDPTNCFAILNRLLRMCGFGRDEDAPKTLGFFIPSSIRNTKSKKESFLVSGSRTLITPRQFRRPNVQGSAWNNFLARSRISFVSRVVFTSPSHRTESSMKYLPEACLYTVVLQRTVYLTVWQS